MCFMQVYAAKIWDKNWGVLKNINVSSWFQSFIACPFGIGMVGYSMMCEGIGFTVASFLSVPLSKYIPRQAQVLSCLLVLMANCVGWLLWQPEEGQMYIVFIISSIYGSFHGMFRTIIAGNLNLYLYFWFLQNWSENCIHNLSIFKYSAMMYYSDWS